MSKIAQLVLSLSLFSVLLAVPQTGFATPGLNCSPDIGSCTCLPSALASLFAIGTIGLGGFPEGRPGICNNCLCECRTEVAEDNCAVGDGTCTDDSLCIYDCGDGAVPACMGGFCVCDISEHEDERFGH